MKTKQIITITAVTAALAIAAAFGIFRTTTPVMARDTSPRDVTHLGVPERNVVNLRGLGDILNKVGRDGSTSSDYRVPPGKVLIITDIQTKMRGDESTRVDLRIILSNPSQGTSREFFSIYDNLDSNGVGHAAIHFTSGLMIGEGQQILIEVFTLNADYVPASNFIQGYEVDASPAV